MAGLGFSASWRQVGWIGVFLAVLIWSAIDPADYATWFLEVSPAMVGAVVLALTRHRFPLTGMTYLLILIHSIILMTGGHYTYAEVPLGEWFSAAFDVERNNYDKLGHIAQGFVPAIIAREIVIRLGIITRAGWRNFFIVSFCLGFSAFYELIEWWVALLSDDAAESFLGTQGYVWDTQSDMALALAGAVLALLLLGRRHDRQMRTAGLL
jgi:putative membrane protein